MLEVPSHSSHCIDLAGALDTGGAAAYLLGEYGLDYKPAYLMKLRSIGGGPAFYRVGRAVRYLPPNLDEYARSRICGPLVTSRERVHAA